jgi:hypothetical protein
MLLLDNLRVKRKVFVLLRREMLFGLRHSRFGPGGVSPGTGEK